MQTNFKRNQKVRLLKDPNPDYTEYEGEYLENPVPVKKGMVGKINIILPNGEYHVEIFDEKGDILAYVPMHEEYLEPVE